MDSEQRQEQREVSISTKYDKGILTRKNADIMMFQTAADYRLDDSAIFAIQRAVDSMLTDIIKVGVNELLQQKGEFNDIAPVPSHSGTGEYQESQTFQLKNSHVREYVERTYKFVI